MYFNYPHLRDEKTIVLPLPCFIPMFHLSVIHIRGTSWSTLWTRWETADSRVKLYGVTGRYWLMPHMNGKKVLDGSKTWSLLKFSHQSEDKRRVSENNLQKTERELLILWVLGWYVHKALYCLVKTGVLLNSCKNIIGRPYWTYRAFTIALLASVVF